MLNKTIKLKEMITTLINPKANANIFVKALAISLTAITPVLFIYVIYLFITAS